MKWRALLIPHRLKRLAEERLGLGDERAPINNAVNTSVNSAGYLIFLPSIGKHAEMAEVPEVDGGLNCNVRLLSQLRVADKINSETVTSIGIIGATRDLENASAKETLPVAGLIVPEIRTALITALRRCRPPNLAEKAETLGFVRSLPDEVSKANGRVGDARCW